MTQEDKELLLKDICARLPYYVKAKDKEGTIITICAYHPYGIIDNYGIMHNVSNTKPYLFPLSSMTEEQKKDIFRNGTFFCGRHNTLGRFPKHNDDYDYVTFEDYLEITEKLNKHHIDYRGLIKKGLALDATGLSIYSTQ